MDGNQLRHISCQTFASLNIISQVAHSQTVGANIGVVQHSSMLLLYSALP